MPNQRHHPQPEDRAGPAKGQRHRDACYVAGAYPAREAGAERLNRRNALLVAGRVARSDHPEHLTEMHDLRTPSRPSITPALGPKPPVVSQRAAVSGPAGRYHGKTAAQDGELNRRGGR